VRTKWVADRYAAGPTCQHARRSRDRPDAGRAGRLL